MKMKSKLFILFLLFIPALFSCRQKADRTLFFELETEFKNPSVEFRPAALWLWNSDVSYSDIDRNLTEFKEAGFGGVFIYQCQGMIDESFVVEHPELYRYAVDAAKKEGLYIRIYDKCFNPGSVTLRDASAGVRGISVQRPFFSELTSEFLSADTDSFNCCREDEDNILAVKKARSIANQLGHNRVLGTAYRGLGQKNTFKDFKRLGDRDYALGVNFMNSYIQYFRGNVYDYPSVLASNLSWWPYYKEQNDYFARLSLLLGKGEQLNEILVLEPDSVTGYDCMHREVVEEEGKGRMDLKTFITQLEEAQVEYDLGAQDIIRDNGSVVNGRIIVGERSYKTVVIPPGTVNLNKAVFKLIRKFAEEDGELVLFSEPTFIDGKEDTGLTCFFSRNLSKVRRYDQITGVFISELLDKDLLEINLTKGTGLYHQRRSYGDGELVFLVNSSPDETLSGTISLPGKSLLEADAADGNFYEYPYSEVNGRINASFRLLPAGSLILFSSSRKTGSYPVKDFFVVWEFMPTETEPEIQRVEDNVLVIDFCDLIIGEEDIKQIHTVEARKHLRKYFDLWNRSNQYTQTVSEQDTSKTSDIKARYYFTVEDSLEMSRFRLAAEQPGIWTVTVNDKPVAADERDFWLDERLGIYRIGSMVKTGLNTIEINVNSMHTLTEIEPVYILGDFAVEPVSTGWVICSSVAEFGLGSWKKQGLPFYSGGMSYGKDYLIFDTASKYSVRFDRWEGAAVKVLVNGKKAGIINHRPYQLDISSYLHNGVNRIEIVVAGDFKNLLGPHHTRFCGKEEEPVAGDSYQLSDYGLIDDFSLWKTY